MRVRNRRELEPPPATPGGGVMEPLRPRVGVWRGWGRLVVNRSFGTLDMTQSNLFFLKVKGFNNLRERHK